MPQNESRKKVALRKRTSCKSCGQVVGPGFRMIAVGSKNEAGVRSYHHECHKCARDWNDQ